MTNPQGTQWESDIVTRAKSYGLSGDRYPKRGQDGEPDLWLGMPEVSQAYETIPVVMWKRLAGKKGDGPRQPDGERRVVIVPFDHFMAMVMDLATLGAKRRILVQAKWCANLNVTKVLGKLVQWRKNHGHST